MEGGRKEVVWRKVLWHVVVRSFPAVSGLQHWTDLLFFLFLGHGCRAVKRRGRHILFSRVEGGLLDGGERGFGARETPPVMSEYVSFAKKTKHFVFPIFRRGTCSWWWTTSAYAASHTHRYLFFPNFSNFPNNKFILFLLRPCPLWKPPSIDPRWLWGSWTVLRRPSEPPTSSRAGCTGRSCRGGENTILAWFDIK